MSAVDPFLVLSCDCITAIPWLANQMVNADLTLLRTFDSKDVRSANADCPCPYHGSMDCNCQVIIFLVYHKGHTAPVTLIVHGYDQSTLFYLVDNPQQRADPCLETAIRNALTHARAPLQTGESLQTSEANDRANRVSINF